MIAFPAALTYVKRLDAATSRVWYVTLPIDPALLISELQVEKRNQNAPQVVLSTFP